MLCGLAFFIFLGLFFCCCCVCVLRVCSLSLLFSSMFVFLFLCNIYFIVPHNYMGTVLWKVLTRV